MGKYAFLALSINPNKLIWKLIYSVYKKYPEEVVKSNNFYVICQGFSEADQFKVKELAPDFHFIFTDKISGTISYIRRTLYHLIPDVFDKYIYDYVILIDDDFNIGEKGLYHYKNAIKELDEKPYIGFVPCHRRMNGEWRLMDSPLEYPYPHDLSAIAMRNGLILRNGILEIDDMFDDRIDYHEEFWLALQVYLRGYDVAKAWVDTYHQSRTGGLGNYLQNKYQVSNSNDAPTSKKIAYDEGLFYIRDDQVFYSGPDVGCISSLAKSIHDNNKEILWKENS